MRRFSVLVAAIVAAGMARPADAQILSARTAAFGRDLAGLYPDDWSDAAVNPALLAPGALAFGRLDWAAAGSEGRRAALGGQAAVEKVGLLFAMSRGLEAPAPGRALENTVVAARLGWPDALGARYVRYSSGAVAHAPHGYAVAAGAHSAAGRGWAAEFLAELAEVGFSGAREAAYRAGEVLLRQAGPERSPGHPGWDQRLVRLRGGTGTGDFLEEAAAAGNVPRQWKGDLRWLEGSLVHLHAFTAGESRCSFAWGVRYTHYELEPAQCAGGGCGVPLAGSRHVLAFNAGVEARLRAPLALRGGLTWAPVSRGRVPLPADWEYVAGVKPSRFRGGVWLGVGWEPREALAVDAAMDVGAADPSLEETRVLVQATYRF